MAISPRQLMRQTRFRERLASVSWRDLLGIGAAVLLSAGLAIWATVKFLRPAPPSAIRMLSGPEGSTYRTLAERYKGIIEHYGVKVQVIPSNGGLDNLQRLASSASKADVAFVPGGLTEGIDTAALM